MLMSTLKCQISKVWFLHGALRGKNISAGAPLLHLLACDRKNHQKILYILNFYSEWKMLEDNSDFHKIYLWNKNIFIFLPQYLTIHIWLSKSCVIRIHSSSCSLCALSEPRQHYCLFFIPLLFTIYPTLLWLVSSVGQITQKQ